MSDGLDELEPYIAELLDIHAEDSCKGEVRIVSPGNEAVTKMLAWYKKDNCIAKYPNLFDHDRDCTFCKSTIPERDLPEGGWSYRVAPLVPTKKLSTWRRIWNWLLSPLW